MIALVAGEVVARGRDHVVLQTAAGVGYRLSVSAHTLEQVPAAGAAVTLHTHLVVREDALILHGFATEAERELFELLIGVPKVGPKAAQAVLGTGSPRELVTALVAGDAKRLQTAPGVGKSLAERIVLELRDKVAPHLVAADPAGEVHAYASDDPRLIARDGLVELGWSLDEAEALLRGLDGATPEELLQGALRASRS